VKRVVALAAVLALAGCGGGGVGPRGGAAGLPGPLPEGAAVAAEDTSAPRAADFGLTLLDGTHVRASRLWATHPVVVDFLASWCERCAARQGMLDHLARKYAGLVAFLGVAAHDRADDLRGYLGSHRVPYAAGIDRSGGIWRDYAVDEPPVLVVIGKGGRLLRGWTVDPSETALDRELAGLARRR
jgi:thiol-disulfide isomerase/thioredoxin